MPWRNHQAHSNRGGVTCVARSVPVAAFALLACVSVPVSSLDAQLASLIPGRARADPGSWFDQWAPDGHRDDPDADSLSLVTEHGVPVALPLSALASVDISRGKSRSRGAMKGAIWGGGFGLLSGPLLRFRVETLQRRLCFPRRSRSCGRPRWRVSLGAAIGAAVQSESWENLDVPVRTALRAHARRSDCRGIAPLLTVRGALPLIGVVIAV